MLLRAPVVVLQQRYAFRLRARLTTMRASAYSRLRADALANRATRRPRTARLADIVLPQASQRQPTPPHAEPRALLSVHAEGAAPIVWVRLLGYWLCGGVLLSRRVAPAVPSALAGLASGFGMGPGVSPPPWPPQHCPTLSTTTLRTASPPLGGGVRVCGWGLVNRIVDARTRACAGVVC
jgi:hypothetical protein